MGSGLDRIFAFGEEQTTATCTIIDIIIQGALWVALQIIGSFMEIKLVLYKTQTIFKDVLL